MAHPRSHALTVLVLDDRPAVRAVLTTTLQVFGFRVLEAASTAEATQLADRLPVAAFVVDLHLASGRSGLEFIQWLRPHAQHEDALVFVVTGERDLSDDERAVIARAGAHIFVKGQSPRLLAEEIHWRLFSEPGPPE